MKLRIPFRYVKPVCIVSALAGIAALAAGRWITGLCFLLGSYLFEKKLYCCPYCGTRLDMKRPLFKGARCPSCAATLRS